MTDSEKLDRLIETVSQMQERFDQIDKRLDKMDSHFNILEHKQDRTAKKLDDLRLDVAVAERDIRRDIFELKDEMETVIEVMKMHDMLPQ